MSDITQVTSGDDEMANMAQRFFTKASDAIVQASRLAKVVEDLQAQVASLTARIDSVVAENEQLRNELGQVRSERDDYRTRLGQSENDHAATKSDYENYKRTAEQVLADTQRHGESVRAELQGKLDALQSDFHNVSDILARTRDDLHVSETRAADLQAKLNEAEVKLEAIANIVAKPEPKEAAPLSDPISASFPPSSEQSSSGTEQPHGEDGKFEAVPMAARDFQY